MLDNIGSIIVCVAFLMRRDMSYPGNFSDLSVLTHRRVAAPKGLCGWRAGGSGHQPAIHIKPRSAKGAEESEHLKSYRDNSCRASRCAEVEKGFCRVKIS
jgi:hypothetical protein